MAQQTITPTTRRPKKVSSPTGTAVKKGKSKPQPKKTLSERALRERRQEEERRRREREKERARRALRRRQLFLLSLIAAVALVVIYWLWVAADIAFRPDGTEDAQPVILFTQGKKEKDKQYSADEVFYRGTHYLPITALEPYFEISQFGDHISRSFQINETGEFATFYINTCNAVINSQKVSLKKEAIVRDGTLYLPLDFFREAMADVIAVEDSAALAAWVVTVKETKGNYFKYQINEASAAIDPSLAPALPETEPEETTEE